MSWKEPQTWIEIGRASVRVLVTLGLVAAFIFMDGETAERLKELTFMAAAFYFADRASTKAQDRVIEHLRSVVDPAKQ